MGITRSNEHVFIGDVIEFSDNSADTCYGLVRGLFEEVT